MPAVPVDVQSYLDALPDERRDLVSAVRATVVGHLPAGYDEQMGHGMIEYVVPLERYPVTYNKQPLSYIALGSQKNHISLYLMGLYSVPEDFAAFRERWTKDGRRLDMGKSCLRFSSLGDLDLALIGETVAGMPVQRFIETYERIRADPLA